MKTKFMLLACCWLLAQTVHAQVVRNYGLIFSDNLKGGHTFFGNTSVATYGYLDAARNFINSNTPNLEAMNDFNQYNGRDTIFPGGATSYHANDYYAIRNVDVDANLPATSLIAVNDNWQYHDESFTPANWPAVTSLQEEDNAPLGYRQTGLNTTLSELRTHYFLRSFSIQDLTQFESFTVTVNFDDGFILYVNGVEAQRTNMPAGPVGYNTRAETDNNGTASYTLPARLFREGTNRIQVEMHRFEPNNGDMRFSLTLAGNAITTVNSTSADLQLPAGTNTIAFARLYWGGKIRSAEATDTRLGQIRLRKGTTGKYGAFVANGIDRSVEGDYTTYQAYTDITAFVRTGKAGTYTVANVPVSEGQGIPGGGFGGWTIVVAYENTNEPFRSVRIYDGYLEVENAGSHNITLNNLNVPNNTLSLSDAFMSTMAWEGDANLAATSTNPAGDFIRLNGITVANGTNPATNFWNGTITRNGAHVTAKSPNYRNQISLDIDELQVGTGYNIQPGATSVTVQFGTERDQYYPSLFGFSILMKDPAITIDKTVVDRNGGNLALNDELMYTFRGTNTGQGMAYNVIITDELPDQIEYIANSLEWRRDGEWVPLNTATIAQNGTTKRQTITAHIGSNATAARGGELAAGRNYEVRFRARVLRTGTITNTAFVMARNTPVSNLTYESFIDESSVDISSQMVLPMTLGQFTGNIKDGSVQLYWTTVQEQNTLRFDIERSFDGQHFRSIGFVKAQGNSSTTIAYRHADELSGWGLEKRAFYRIRTIDIDGKISYSRFISLSASGSTVAPAATVFPNPLSAGQELKLQVFAQKQQQVVIRLVSSSGIAVKQFQKQLLAGSNLISLPEAAPLKQGIYIVQTLVDGQALALNIQVK